MFQHSPISDKILELAEPILGHALALILLLKICAAVSCKLELPRLSVMHVGPTRQGKSLTSKIAMNILSPEFYIDLRSDFTMNSLRRYADAFLLGVCLFANDVTAWLSSKAQRLKDRVIGGLSELVSDAKYIYQDFRQKIELVGAVTMVLNITSESFQNNKDRLFGSTFSERLLTVHYVMTQKEKEEWVEKEEEIRRIHFDSIITVNDIETQVEIPPEYFSIIKYQAKKYSYETLNSPVSCQDLIKAMMRAHAALNKRSSVCLDDLILVTMIQPYLKNPFSPHDGEIVRLRAQGLSLEEICKEIGKGNYKGHVQKVVKKAELRGILPPPE